ncbi:hypothetical protein U9608_002603 [Vibrio alginolyticus]|uniref:hypothetical protein n=1 Tax=Vibrio TaxID=662 RepID=UPI00102E025C|nr:MULTISPECIES: hypothetical protein [Vibrio]EMB9235069.1 hypothetical protein [Vibrio alginolyticus]MCF7509469.1 hypothetical protein [Vibrio sp. D54]RZV20172.1 hypothetical protein EOJ41_08570 [Vibrio alginolyticus]
MKKTIITLSALLLSTAASAGSLSTSICNTQNDEHNTSGIKEISTLGYTTSGVPNKFIIFNDGTLIDGMKSNQEIYNRVVSGFENNKEMDICINRESKAITAVSIK